MFDAQQENTSVALESEEALAPDKLTEQLLNDYFTDLLQSGVAESTTQCELKQHSSAEKSDEGEHPVSAAPVVRVHSADLDDYTQPLLSDTADFQFSYDAVLQEEQQDSLLDSPKLLGDLSFLRDEAPRFLTSELCSYSDDSSVDPEVASEIDRNVECKSTNIEPSPTVAVSPLPEGKPSLANKESPLGHRLKKPINNQVHKNQTLKETVQEKSFELTQSVPAQTPASKNAMVLDRQAKTTNHCSNKKPEQVKVKSSSEWLDAIKASNEGIETLLFSVQGLTMGVPLARLGQIHAMPQSTPLPGQPKWMLGVGSVGQAATPMKVVNTARWVMPERYQDQPEKRPQYVIGLHGTDWCLAVDEIKQPVTLRPKDIVWKREGSQRPWLAGTIKAHMCALLDVDTLVRQLSSDAQALNTQLLNQKPLPA